MRSQSHYNDRKHAISAIFISVFFLRHQLCMVQKLFVSQKKQISDLQTQENKAFRYTVNPRKCTAISALRCEMGASLQKVET